MNSRTYQTSIETNEWNADDRDNFSHAVPRRLECRRVDGCAVARQPECGPNFPEVPRGHEAEQFADPHVGKDGFLDLFGRPARESACECERRTRFQPAAGAEPGQRHDHLRRRRRPERPGGEARSGGKASDAIVEDLYLASLGRFPDSAESAISGVTVSERRRERAARAQDLLWALAQQQGIFVQLL